MLNFSSLPRIKQMQAFMAFYDRYAPTLWEIILSANLPLTQSKMILSDTFLAAWPYPDRQAILTKQGFAWLLWLAYTKGLPAEALPFLNRTGRSKAVLFSGSRQPDWV